MPRAAGHTSSAPWPHAAPPPQRHQDDQEWTRAQAPQGTMEAPTGPTGSPATHAGQSHTPPGQNPRPSQTAQNTHFANVRYANFAKCMFCGALHRGQR